MMVGWFLICLLQGQAYLFTASELGLSSLMTSWISVTQILCVFHSVQIRTVYFNLLLRIHILSRILRNNVRLDDATQNS